MDLLMSINAVVAVGMAIAGVRFFYCQRCHCCNDSEN